MSSESPSNKKATLAPVRRQSFWLQKRLGLSKHPAHLVGSLCGDLAVLQAPVNPGAILAHGNGQLFLSSRSKISPFYHLMFSNGGWGDVFCPATIASSWLPLK
jgi:hypothetical protein